MRSKWYRFVLAMMVFNGHSLSHANNNHESPDFFQLDLAIEDTQPVGEKDNKQRWPVYGSLRFQSQYATQQQLNNVAYSRQNSELSQARTSLRLNFMAQVFERVTIDMRGIASYDVLYHYHRDNVSREEFDSFADELAIRDAHLQFETWDNLWFKFGRQVIAFGESDFTQIVDVVNPRDEREFGLVDLEDARLPITATRLSYVGQRWGIDMVFSHEFEPNRNAGEGADFDRYITVRHQLRIDKQREPTVNFLRPGKLLRGFWSHAQGDINIVFAESVDQTPVLALSPRGDNYVDEVYPEVTTYGVSANWITGHWLFKGEVARKNNTFIPRRDTEQQLALGFGRGELFSEKDIVQTLIGLEYSAYQDIQLATEITTTTILDYETHLLPQKQESILSSRVVFEFYRDTADVEILWAHWLDVDSDSVRLTYNYEYSDEIQLSLGYIDFLSNDDDGPLYPYRNNDRVFASMTYSF